MLALEQLVSVSFLIMMFKGMAYFEGEFTWIIHRWSMKGGLSEIEQAIEDRYWGRRAKRSDGGGGENEMNGAEGDENKIEEILQLKVKIKKVQNIYHNSDNLS